MGHGESKAEKFAKVRVLRENRKDDANNDFNMILLFLLHLTLGELACWNEDDTVIRCTWPNSINGQIEYTRGSSKSEIFTDCRYDVDLVTITRHGCTISPMNPNIHYHLTLVQNGASIESIAEFDPREFLKITIPPKNFVAERRGNGTVYLHWENDFRAMMMIMMLQDSIIYRLVWHARMELEQHFKVLGVHNELQQEVYLDDLPNNQILELCIQMRKKGSLIEDWSSCSQKTTLRTRVAVPTEGPAVEVTLPSPIANDLPQRERMMILIASVVFIVSVVGGTIIVKNNWRTIRNFFFPKLPHPDMYFDDTNDFNDRADLIHYVEEYDKLSLTLEDDENTVLVQAQIETTHISSN